MMTSDTRTGAEARTEHLVEQRRLAAADKQAHALAAVQSLLARGERVSFTEAARSAKVSTWFVYNNPEVRAAVERAIAEQSGRRSERAAKPVDDRTLSGLRTELATARAEIRDLRDEREQLKRRLRRDLGEQVDAMGKRELFERLKKLEHENAQLQSTLRATADELSSARCGLEEALADRDGAQLALRQMMRDRGLDRKS